MMGPSRSASRGDRTTSPGTQRLTPRMTPRMTSPVVRTPNSTNGSGISRSSPNISTGSGVRGTSPLSVPKRADLKSPSSRADSSGLRRTTPRGIKAADSKDVSQISNVPTRDAMTGRRMTPRAPVAVTTPRVGATPRTPRQAVAGVATTSAYRGRSPMEGGAGSTTPRLGGDKSTNSSAGLNNSSSSRLDAELEYDRRKKRLDKISQVAMQVEKEYNAAAQDEARVKPGMATSGGVKTTARRDPELGPRAPHRQGSPAMQRLGSEGDCSAAGGAKRRDVSPSTAVASKRQYPGRNSHITSDPEDQVHKVHCKAQGTGPRKDNFGTDSKPWHLNADSSADGSSVVGGRSVSGSRRVQSANINRQQDPTLKRPVVSKAFVSSYRKDSNPVHFASTTTTTTAAAANGEVRSSSGTRRSNSSAASRSSPELFDHPTATKASLRPGYQGHPNGLSGTSANHDYHRASNNILGLRHTDKAGSKVEQQQEITRVQGKRCSSADGGGRSGSTANSGTGNPSDMCPIPGNRRLSAERVPTTARVVASSSRRTSSANMLSFDNQTSGRSSSAVDNRTANLASTDNGTATTTTTTKTVKFGRAASTGGAGGYSVAPQPTKRTSSPSNQTSNNNPLSIASRHSSPVVVVPKYRRAVAMNRSNPQMLTEIESTGGKNIPAERSTSVTRRKYANASCSVSRSVGGTLNWASDAAGMSAVALQ